MNIRRAPMQIPVITSADLPPRALEIHRLRPDVRHAFDVSQNDGRLALYWWYFIHGFREMWLNFRPLEDASGPANQPADHLPVHGPVPVTWLMREFWLRGVVPGSSRALPKQQRPLLHRLFRTDREPVTSGEQKRLLAWYFCRALHDFNLDGLLTPNQSARLLAGVRNGDNTPAILVMAHSMASDLHPRFPSAASAEWRQWCLAEGRRRFPILAHPLIAPGLFGSAFSQHDQTESPLEGDPNGVNLIGHAGSRSGVGEDLRMAARALETVGIPFVVRNVAPSTGIAAEENDLTPYLADHSPFCINVFCMAGMETVSTLSNRRELLDGKVSIGFWPWELPEWPKLWEHAPQLMNELWASTTFTADAYRRSTSVPVRQVPMAVDISDGNGLTRRDFGLPEDVFLFGFSFDGHSSFSRKNPVGCIEAFQQAFPNEDEAVHLVLKGLRVGDHPAWQELEALSAADPRITLLSASLPRGDLIDLYRTLDCFVSLHRSEGFGRNIAECMLLGKPVIVTDYSGNTDFTREGTAALVPARLRPVGDDEYPFGAGQMWAEPDITYAARHMREMVVNNSWRVEIAESGRQFIENHHKPSVIGTLLKIELERLVSSRR